MMASDKVTCILPTHTFLRIGSDEQEKPLPFSAFPLCVDFHRILKQKTDSVFQGVCKWDLLHIVIALYDVCLPDIGVETLRENICASGAKTILLLRHPQDVLKEYQENRTVPSTVPSNPDHSDTSSVSFVSDGEEEVERVRMYASVFSDSESSEEESESETDREESTRFRSRAQDFLNGVAERRQQRSQSKPTQEAVGVESCLVAALTYHHAALKSKEKIIDLCLLSTRRRYRCCGVGTYMLKVLKDESVVGFYDSIVTHADNRAVDFFKSSGFSDDFLLNSKFRDLEDEWTNTTTMSYFPPFSTAITSQKDITDLEVEMELWKSQSIAAYQTQVIFMNKIFQEIRTLRNQVVSQNKKISMLTAELEKAKKENYQRATASFRASGILYGLRLIFTPGSQNCRIFTFVTMNTDYTNFLKYFHIGFSKMYQVKHLGADRFLLVESPGMKPLGTNCHSHTKSCKDLSFQFGVVPCLCWFQVTAGSDHFNLGLRPIRDSGQSLGQSLYLLLYHTSGLMLLLSEQAVCLSLGGHNLLDHSICVGLLQKEILKFQLTKPHSSPHTVDLMPGLPPRDGPTNATQLKDFTAFMTDYFESGDQKLEIQGSEPAVLSKDLMQNIKAHISSLVAPAVHQQLYYSGGKRRPMRMLEILKTGFTPEDFCHGEYGTGLYFSTNPLVASDLLPPYQVLVADVYIGRTEVVYHKQAGKVRPTEGCDSLMEFQHGIDYKLVEYEEMLKIGWYSWPRSNAKVVVGNDFGRSPEEKVNHI
ncbi:uncharacterized protein RCH25_049309 [Pelodytes ibericus]